MTYIVLARKWRPSAFDEVIGQEHIITTLKNAIGSGRVGHAYLFTGPRGVGKTSTARIFAKGINCQKGPTVTPCGNCPSCADAAAGASMDVIEIDGASNNSIDEIRALRENVRFSPAYGKYKIYIIDEVHMLTTGAFNALLKTLEEPPAHVKFIFATTRPEKVPPTILSRCQRFDFKRLTLKSIMDKLASIAKAEKIDIDKEAVFAVASASEGSMRDAESILDQMVSFTKGGISEKDVVDALGLIDDKIIFETANLFARKDAAGLLVIAEKIVDAGKDISQFLSGLLRHFRNLMVIKVCSESVSGAKPVTRHCNGNLMIDLPEEKIAVVSEQAKLFEVEDMLYIFYTLAGTAQSARRSEVARFLLESAFIKLARRGDIVQVGELLRRIEAMRPQGEGSAGFAGGGGQQPGPYAKPPYPGTQGFFKKPPANGAGGPVRRSPSSFGNSSVNGAGGPSVGLPSGESGSARQDMDPKPAGPEDGGSHSVKLDDVKGVWHEVIQALKDIKMSVASSLLEGDAVAVHDGMITIGFSRQFNFNREVLDQNSHKKLIADTFSRFLGCGVNVEIKAVDGVTQDSAVNGQPSAGDSEAVSPGQGGAVSRAAEHEAERDIFSEPIVRQAMEIFKGRVVTDNGRRR